MERDRQTEGRLGDSDILGRRMGLNQQIEVVEEQFRHQVDNIIADPLSGNEESHDHDGRDRRGLPVISTRGNRSGEVSGTGFRDHFGRDRHERRPAGGKLMPNKFKAQSARSSKIRVERAFCYHPPAFSVPRVIDPGEIAEGQARRFQNDGGSQRNARLLGPERHALALQIRRNLDPGFFACDELNVAWIERRDAAQLVAARVLAADRIRQSIGEREGELALAGLEQPQIFDRSLGCLRAEADTFYGIAEDARKLMALPKMLESAIPKGGKPRCWWT
jgi:hypothetical protein